MNVSLKLKELFGTDLRSLAVFRILISLLIIVDLIIQTSDIKAFYTDEGLLPRILHINQFGNWYLSLYMLNGHVAFASLLFLLTIFFAVLLLIGYKTRLVNFMLWFLIISLHARNPLVLLGGDILLRMLLFWGMFLPLGAKWSIDSLFSSTQKLPTSVLSFGTVGIFAQVVFMYFFTALLKISPEWLEEGSAIYYALSNDQFVTVFGHKLLAFPNTLKILTYLSYLLELFGPLLLFIPIFIGPIRTIAVFLFISFHFGLWLSLVLGIFPFISSIAMIPFLPTWFWDKFTFLEGFSNKIRETLLTKKNFVSTPIHINSSWFLNSLALFFLIYIFLWNLSMIDSLKFNLPRQIQWIGHAFQIGQKWNMFMPELTKFDGWYVIPGKLKNGKWVDLFNGGKNLNWNKPKLVVKQFKTNRWRSYIRNAFVDYYNQHPAYYARYLCNMWNKNHSGSKKLEELKIYIMREDTLLNYKTIEPKAALLYEYKCML